MQVYPLMNIRFPEDKEGELAEAMKGRAVAPWRWRDMTGDPMALEGMQYFDRDAVKSDPPCMLCLLKKGPGNLAVVNIIPHFDTLRQGSIKFYVRVLRDFDERIAEPAAEGLGGMNRTACPPMTRQEMPTASSAEITSATRASGVTATSPPGAGCRGSGTVGAGDDGRVLHSTAGRPATPGPQDTQRRGTSPPPRGRSALGRSAASAPRDR